MRYMGEIKILLAALVLASITGTGAANTGYFIVPLDQITNWPIDHLIYPPSGNITLGGVPFSLNREFQTQQRMLLDNPTQGVLNINITSPLKIYVLLNGAYVLKQYFEKEVGYIKMEFNDGSSFKKSIIAGRDLRETWAGDENLYTISSISGNPNWQNVWSESQWRVSPATAFIDMLTIPLPEEFQSRTLTAISIYDTSITDVGSSDPSLIIMGITVEYKPEIKGFISISSTRSGASIYLDGVYQGKTPKIITDVSVGSHYIELKLDGYNLWSESINVISGNNNYISVPLVLITPSATANKPNPTSTPLKTPAITQTSNPTKIPITTEPPVTQTPSKSETNWTLLGGAFLAIILIGAIVIRMRKPNDEVPKTIEKPMPREKQNQIEINITSAFGYKGATILYKIKLENTISVPVADVKVSLFVPNVFILLEKEKSLALLKAGESKTVTFEIRPTGECGDCEISGKVTYYDTGSNKTKETEIGSKMLSIVCPMLKVKEITETQWDNTVSNLIETEESTKEIDMPAESLFVIVSRIIKDMHMHMLKPETTQSQQLFNGVARFFGEGVKGLKYAAQVEVVGGAKKSKLILKAWAEKEDALTGFYHGILDEIEKRINVKGYIDDSIVQQYNIHIGDKIGTQVKDSVVQRSNIGVDARKCPNCGREVDANEKFCMDCGAKL